MTYKEFASQINVKVDNPPNDCDMSREITIEDCIYLFNSLGRQIRHLQERNRWHTGTPTDIEEDERWSWNYAIVCDIDYDAIGLCLSGLLYKPDLERGVFSAPLDGGKELTVPFSEVIAWRKIEPYKEKEQ